MRLGFSTNSIGDIDPLLAVPMLRDLGYGSLAITLDHHTIDPFAADLGDRIDRWRRTLAASGMACVVETGARHLLDPCTKHEPTLVSAKREGRERRVAFTLRAIDIAADLGADCVSLWSGVGRDGADDDVFWDRLVAGLGPILDHAAERGVRLGFEPEPGMMIDSLARFRALRERMGSPPGLGLTVDLGHMECMGEWPLAGRLGTWAGQVANVHIDDMRACRHDHLPPGTGDVEFGPLLATLSAAGYRGGLHVELPRQSHRWLETAGQSARFLGRLMSST